MKKKHIIQYHDNIETSRPVYQKVGLDYYLDQVIEANKTGRSQSALGTVLAMSEEK